MAHLLDPALLAGLLALVVLEIVLGIDNLVFVAILSDKLDPSQRDKARTIGLSLALVLRLGLLAGISWIVGLKTPLVTLAGFALSGRDLILLAGGLFLTFKATMELHERLEGAGHEPGKATTYAPFWTVVTQIILLDLVFSIDSVIMAVGMVDNLSVMVAAVIISMGVMLVASRPLARFVTDHPTVVVLCLSFLLMIGFSLIAEGFHVHVPKGYLYAAIGFSILIETFNQVRHRKASKEETARPFRLRTTERILRLLGDGPPQATGEAGFADPERQLVSGVLALADRPVTAWATPRARIVWLDATRTPAEIRERLLSAPHGLLPVGDGSLDRPLGVVRAKEALAEMASGQSLAAVARSLPVLTAPASAEAFTLLDVLRRAEGNLVLLVDEAGQVAGLVTPVDLLSAIAGDATTKDPGGTGPYLPA